MKSSYYRVGITVLFCGFLNAQSLSAQVYQAWMASYSTPAYGHDQSWAMTLDAAGNVYVTGRSQTDGVSSDWDYLTIKYNTEGDEQWVVRYDGEAQQDDIPYDIAVDEWGNAYVTGASENGLGEMEFLTVKYNSEGDEQWVVRDTLGSEAYVIALDDEANVYIAGLNYRVVKYDSDGAFQWAYQRSGYDISGIVVDSDQNVLVTGRNDNSYFSNYLTVKLDPLGGFLWEASYTSSLDLAAQPHAIAVDEPGNVYVTGESREDINYVYDFVTVKYSADGVQQWVRNYDGPANGSDAAFALVLDLDGDIYVTGGSEGNGGYSDFVTVKYNPAGAELWAVRYDGSDHLTDTPRAMIFKLGYLYITGCSQNTNTALDFLTIKYDLDGAIQWTKESDSGANLDDDARDIAVDNQGNVYVTGFSNLTSTDTQFTTIKYQEGSAVESEPNQGSLQQFVLYPAYPNPFNPITAISYKLQASSFVNLSVYDIAGRQVTELVNGWRDAGRHEVRFDGSGLASGVYIYRLRAGQYTASGKMVLMK